jgi:hypothetical protein
MCVHVAKHGGKRFFANPPTARVSVVRGVLSLSQGIKPWVVWQVEASGGGFEQVAAMALPGWGPDHPLYPGHVAWRGYFREGRAPVKRPIPNAN